MAPSQLLSQSLAACALAMELHGVGSPAVAAALSRLDNLTRSLPLEQQSLTPQGLDALCRMLACDADRGLVVVQSLVIRRAQRLPPAAAPHLMTQYAQRTPCMRAGTWDMEHGVANPLWVL